MKYFLLIAAVCIAVVCFTACHQPKKSVECGAYGNATELTADETELFNSVVLAYDSTLTPIKVSRQVVAGMNYRFECQSASGEKVEVTVFQPLPSSGEKPTITSVNGKQPQQ